MELLNDRYIVTDHEYGSYNVARLVRDDLIKQYTTIATDLCAADAIELANELRQGDEAVRLVYASKDLWDDINAHKIEGEQAQQAIRDHQATIATFIEQYENS